jgi:hypothetical protein
VVVGVREGNLYKLQGNIVQDLVHNNDSLYELWKRKLGNLHYMDFFILRGNFIGLPEFRIE